MNEVTQKDIIHARRVRWWRWGCGEEWL